MPTKPSNSRHFSRQRAAGFTLVEAIATMTIVATIMAVVSRVVLVSVDAYAAATTRAELSSGLSTALERMCAELRQIPLVSGGSSAPDIASVSATSITWSANSTLALSGSNLTLALAGGSACTLLTNVSAFNLQCYDESNVALASSLSGNACAAIRRVQITVSVQRGGITETLRTRVFLRSQIAGSST